MGVEEAGDCRWGVGRVLRVCNPDMEVWIDIFFGSR